MSQQEPTPATEATPSQPTSTPPPRRTLRRLVMAGLKITLGLSVGLGVAEGAFRRRDQGAFPLVNTYERDPARGVRLLPGATTRVKRPGGGAFDVRVNHDGYRGPEWPAPSKDEVVIVGDSQSFGFGVEEHEAMASRLRSALGGGRSVIDASVPTYGPPEYEMTARQVLSSRKAGTVVLAVNLINDLGEIGHPNRDRHAAVDGWAMVVREGESAPSSSPLRAKVIAKSHAAFALWRWQKTREREGEPVTVNDGFDALVRAGAPSVMNAREHEQYARAVEARQAAIDAAKRERDEAQEGIVLLVKGVLPLFRERDLRGAEMRAYIREGGEPTKDEDFELNYGGCAAISYYLYERRGGRNNRRFNGYPTYTTRITAVRIRDEVEAEMRSLAAANFGGKEISSAIAQAFERRDRARRQLAEAERVPMPNAPGPRPPSPFAPFVSAMAALAKEHGAAIVVVPIPLDASVVPEIAERRGLSRDDAASIRRVSDDLIGAARAMGALTADVAPSLAALGEAAFLDDGHLSREGHDVVAKAVAASLAGKGES